MTDVLWTSDFDWSPGKVRVRATGAVVPLAPAVLAEVAVWLAYYVPVRLKAAVTRLVRPGPVVWFAPERPRPWYLLGAAATWAGVRFARSPDQAQASFQFEDRTHGRPGAAGAGALNGRCLDVSKSRVATVFEEVFGYPLLLDPARHVGEAVVKGENNGDHDGRVIRCPAPRVPGQVYQRLIDTVEDGLATDLRTPFVGGRPVLVFIKQRSAARRFENHNSRCRLTTPDAVFSPEEIERLSAFAAAMHLDWGGLDVLRDRADGRLYVVDVNKTDMGPPIALPWADKLRATRLMARALLELLEARRP
jgi:hypothetical protein